MTEPKAPAPKRVAVITSDGQFGTVEEHEAGLIEQSGGRVLTRKELAQKLIDEEYARKSTASKVAGAVVGPTAAQLAEPTAQAITGKVNPDAVAAHPAVEAFSHGGLEPFTLGLERAGIAKATEALAGKEARQRYVEHGQQVDEAYAGTKLAGNIAGMAAQLGMGTGGAAKAVPGLGISALGEGAGGLAKSALAGVAERGALGRAAQTAAELGARGLTEGAFFGGGQELATQLQGDPELNADKILAATGSGALWGGLGGAALGGAGSLAKSGFGRVTGMLSRDATKLEEAVAPQVAAPAPTHLPFEPGDIQPHQKLAMVPLSEVAETAPWSEGKLGSIRKTLDEGGKIKPVRLMRDDEGRWAISDGIHRTAISREQGMSHIPAIVDAGEHVTPIAAAPPPIAAPPAKRGIGDVFTDLKSVEGQRGLAYDQAWRSIGAGQGMQTTRYAKQAARYLPNGTRDVGEVLMRRGIINAEAGLLEAAKNGTPAALLPKIESEVESVGQQIGNITNMSPARISGAAIDDAVGSVIAKYEGEAGRAHVANAVRDYGAELRSVLGIASRDESVSLQDLLKQRKVLDDIVYKEAAFDPKARVQALREVRTNLESIIADAIDESSGKIPGELKAQYKTLKRDYFALSVAKDAAEDSAARMSKNRTISASDYATAIASAASGHLLAAPVAAIGHKLARERGNAVAAVALYNAANSGKLTSLVSKVDAQINAAAHGLLTSPPKGAIPGPTGNPRIRAQTTMKQIAAMQADPEGTTEKIAAQVEAVNASHPEIASALAQRHVAAITFLASKMPVVYSPDPLDPHPAPRMSDADAATFNRYEWYAAKPDRFFAEMARGRVTYEGAETAQALMPRAFAELQERTMDALATHMARGRSVPFQQRLKIGDMLDIPATPAQQPQHAAFLQKNVLPLTQSNKAAPAKPRSSSGLSQRSALDTLEANGPGRR